MIREILRFKMRNLKWFLRAYFQFVWQTIIMPVGMIWSVVKFIFRLVGSLLGGKSGIMADLKNIKVTRFGDNP